MVANYKNSNRDGIRRHKNNKKDADFRKKLKEKNKAEFRKNHPAEAVKQDLLQWLSRMDKQDRGLVGLKPKKFNKGWGRKKKVDKFADQKRWAKEWTSVNRQSHKTYKGYIEANKELQALYKEPHQKKVVIIKPKVALSTGYGPVGYKTNDVMQSMANAHFTGNAVIASSRKMPLTTYDKVFYYYTVQTPLTMYAHKAFILLEMQLNATLVRAKLVPYLFMVRDLCFYRLVQINAQIAKNPHQVVSLYDSVSVPVYLHNYMYYRQYRIQYSPQNVGVFFKKYRAHLTNYTNNKVWLLSNFITSDVTAESITFDYPNITLYMGPFKRFTKLYYKNHPYAPQGQHRHLNHSHTVLKLKLFEYAAFYR